MFTSFFYMLRSAGIMVSMTEWLTFIEALNKGLNEAEFTRFYHLARAILVKSEADFDKFDQAFLTFFHLIVPEEQISDEVMGWLDKPRLREKYDRDRQTPKAEEDARDFWRMLRDMLKEQDSEHNGGSRFVGTGGSAVFGHDGEMNKGLRVGGESQRRAARETAGARRFRDFRDDQVLNARSFQMAFRALRQFSNRVEAPKDVLNLDETIRRTGDNCGRLELVFEKPRKNIVKLMMLIDSGGSMDEYSHLSASLFQAVDKSNRFKDLKIFYFHNCIKGRLYTTPAIDRQYSIPTDWVLANIDGEYKVIIVGDALMDMSELNDSYRVGDALMPSGLTWLKRFKTRYRHLVWLNPGGDYITENAFWARSHHRIRQEVDMYRLTIEDLGRSFKKLMAAR
jgi:uncharacterized protein with von Willebrand factor type A (vWA) domain